MKSSNGITLIEVLFILVVLAVLLAVVFPVAPHGTVDRARRASAKNDITQIATALVAYETEYGRFPTTNGDVQDVGGPILQALLGVDASLNPRKIVFLEIQPVGKGRGA